MTICEFYTVIGGNYDEVLDRLQHEELVRRFVKRFLTDRTHENLVAARNNNDVASAFRAAHTLKGVALNLGLSSLANACSAMTEAIRGRSEMCSPELYEAVKAEYARVRDGLDRLDA